MAFLINQNVVTAASGFPYTIAVPGSYKLTGNLTVRPGVDAIDIVVPGVTLDLNGFAITCPGCTGASGAGINSTSAGTTVRNGTILGFHAGLVFTQGAAKVDLVTILGSGTSGYTVGILSYSDLRISNSSVSNNDYGVSSSGDLALTHSVIKQNYYGVSTQGDGLIVENVIQGNTVGLSGFAGSLFGSQCFFRKRRQCEWGRIAEEQPLFQHNLLDVWPASGEVNRESPGADRLRRAQALPTLCAFRPAPIGVVGKDEISGRACFTMALNRQAS
jgi:hypothetical protein